MSFFFLPDGIEYVINQMFSRYAIQVSNPNILTTLIRATILKSSL